QQRIAQQDEVDDVAVLVQRPRDLAADPIVVAMDPLADISRKGDEVRRAEDQLFLFQRDPPALTLRDGPPRLGSRRSVFGIGRAAAKVGHRRSQGVSGRTPESQPAISVAQTRSAVVPGLRRWPSLRSQKSNSAA